MDITKAELRERLLDDCDPEYICDLVGVEMRHRGRVTEVLCPFHDDRHYGNARIRGKGVYCFACSKQFSVFDIVMKKLNIPFYEAYKFVAEQTGDVSTYLVPKTKNQRKKQQDDFPLSVQDLKFIGFDDHKIKIIDRYTNEKPADNEKYDCLLEEDPDFPDGKWMYAVYKTLPVSIKTLWKEDKAATLQMLGDKVCEVSEILYERYREDAWDYCEPLDKILRIYQRLKDRGYKKAAKKKLELEVTHDPTLFF